MIALAIARLIANLTARSMIFTETAVQSGADTIFIPTRFD